MSLNVISKMMGNPEKISDYEMERLMRRFETPHERKMRYKRMAKSMGLTHGKGKSSKKKQSNKKK